MTAVPGLDSRSALAPPATVGASRDAGFGLVSQGGAVDSESAAIAMASLCLKAGLAPRPRSPGAAASASILVGYDIDCCINRLFILLDGKQRTRQLKGCSFRRKTTDTTKHTGADLWLAAWTMHLL